MRRYVGGLSDIHESKILTILAQEFSIEIPDKEADAILSGMH